MSAGASGQSGTVHRLPVWPEHRHQDGPGARLMALDHTCAATAVLRAPMLDIHDLFLHKACGKLEAAL